MNVLDRIFDMLVISMAGVVVAVVFLIFTIVGLSFINWEIFDINRYHLTYEEMRGWGLGYFALGFCISFLAYIDTNKNNRM